MPEVKEVLKPYLGKRVQYSAIIERVDYSKGLALLRNIELKSGEKVDHLWVNLTQRIIDAHTNKRTNHKRMPFSGIVNQYYGLQGYRQVIKYGITKSKLKLKEDLN